MNDNQKQLEEWSKLDCDATEFDELENKLNTQLEEQLSDLESLELDSEKIGNPDAIGETVSNVVWEQFLNQVGVVAGEDFIRENRGLKLDLRDSAHIQTAENFEKAKLAIHNHYSAEQLKQNYDRYKNKPHNEFRKEHVNPGMDATLERAGRLHDKGIETVTDIYTGRQIPTQVKLEDGRNNPKAAQREHVKSSEKLYQDPSLQMANTDEELAAVINDPNNLQGYTTAKRNNRKSNKSESEMEDCDKTKHWEEANKKAEQFINEKKKEGEERLKSEGRKTQKEEALRISEKALRSIIMGFFVSLLKEVIRKLIAWFQSANRQLKTFINSVKEAIKTFVSNLKEHLLNAGNTLITTIATAIFGPVIGMIKKAWIFLKQGYKSLKDAITFLKNPNNKNMPFSLKLMEVGKIVIAGLTAGGAIVLSEVIEKVLMGIPGFAIEIPLLGSLANIIGLFLGAVVSGIIGALALNLIDRAISKKLKAINLEEQIEKKRKILETQGKLIEVTKTRVDNTRLNISSKINERHAETADMMKDAFQSIQDNSRAIETPLCENAEVIDDESEHVSENVDAFNDISNDLNSMK